MGRISTWTSRKQPEKSFVWTQIIPATLPAAQRPPQPVSVCWPKRRRETFARSARCRFRPTVRFMAEVPADVPLGFEALDENGRVLRREAPMVWVRPGENRSCIGCHEPRNRSPHNHRPLAVSVPMPCLSLKSAETGPKEVQPMKRTRPGHPIGSDGPCRRGALAPAELLDRPHAAACPIRRDLQK